MAAKNRFQLVAAAEAQAGVAVTNLLSASNAAYLVIDPSCTFNPTIFERANIVSGSLSPRQPLAGLVTGNLQFQLELAGTGTTTPPGWGLLMRACGMEQYTLRAAAIGAVTNGPFFHGESVTGTGLTGAVVITDIYTGSPVILYRATADTLAGGVALTGATSGATATTSSASWAYGTAWVPTSDEVLTMDFASTTGTNAAGNEVIGATSGAVGILITAASGSSGTLRMRVLGGTFTAAETLNNVTQTGTIVNVSGFSQTGFPALSMALNEDGPTKILKGCRGTFSLAGNLGEAMIFSFNFSGLRSGNPVDTGTLVNPPYDTVVPPAMLGVTLNVGNDATTSQANEFSPRFQAITFDQSATLAIPRDAGESTGVYDSAHQTARASTGSMTIDVGPEAQYPFIRAMIEGTSTRIRETIGTVDGNAFTIYAPSAVFTDEAGGDSEGIATRQLSYRLASRRPGGVDRNDSEIVLIHIGDSTSP